MTFTIHAQTRVVEFQKVFAQFLPKLKPVFFRQHTEGDMWSGFMVINNQIMFGELSDKISKYAEPFTVSSNMSVADFENVMLTRYGLSIRIFRLHFGDWVETTDTRHLDLEGQNERGHLSNPVLHEILF
jgi:hypothetical protein